MNLTLPSWDRQAPGIEAPHPGVITLGPSTGADTSAGTTPAVRLPFASAPGGRPFALGQARLPPSDPTNPHPAIPAAARLPLGEGLSADRRGESLRLAGGVTDEDLTKCSRPSRVGVRGPISRRLAGPGWPTYESAAAHASRPSSGSHFPAPYGRRDSGVGGIGSHARPSAAFECYAHNARENASLTAPVLHDLAPVLGAWSGSGLCGWHGACYATRESSFARVAARPKCAHMDEASSLLGHGIRPVTVTNKEALRES